MRLLPLLICLPLVACAPQSANEANEAAEAANNYQPMEPLNPPPPGSPGGLANDKTPIGEGPIAPDSAQGAAQVVQTYYAHLEKGDFRQAWLLWGNRGEASGMTAQAFEDSFGKYSEHHANIGAPGEIDAGAGQRHVTVPVQLYGRLKAGNKPFYMLGSVTLHRTDVDGASDEQRKWRISSTDIKPSRSDDETQPPVAVEDNRSNLRFRCIDGSKIAAAFDPDKGVVTLSRGGKRLATLQQQRSGSGIWYKGQGYEFRGKGDEMDFTAPGLPPLPCTAIR